MYICSRRFVARAEVVLLRYIQNTVQHSPKITTWHVVPELHSVINLSVHGALVALHH